MHVIQTKNNYQRTILVEFPIDFPAQPQEIWFKVRNSEEPFIYVDRSSNMHGAKIKIVLFALEALIIEQVI